MTPPETPRRGCLIDAVRYAGHGLHPDVAIALARHYLGVDLLPGSNPLTASQVTDYERQVEIARERWSPLP